jgi:hypothetical protein
MDSWLSFPCRFGRSSGVARKCDTDPERTVTELGLDPYQSDEMDDSSVCGPK